MTASELKLIQSLLNKIEEKNERITQLRLESQREHWHKHFNMIQDDFTKLCIELDHHGFSEKAVKMVIKHLDGDKSLL